MTPARTFTLFAPLSLAALCLIFLVELSRRADAGFLTQMQAERTGESLAQQLTVERSPARLVIHLDRGVAPDCLASGWTGSLPRPHVGALSVGPRASLNLAGMPAGNIIVTLGVEPFLASGLPVQRVRISAKNRPLGEWVLTQPGPQDLRVSVPAQSRDASGHLDLQLEFPDAAAPLHDASETRRRAITLVRIEADAA